MAAEREGDDYTLPAGEPGFNVYQVRIRTHQTDLNAAMYHGQYFDIFDDARIETFRRIGYTYERMVQGEWTAVIRRVDAEFFLPARMDDLVSVTVTIPRFTPATMAVHYECRRNGDRLAAATAVFAFVDAGGKPLRVPADLRRVVEDHASTLIPATSS